MSIPCGAHLLIAMEYGILCACRALHKRTLHESELETWESLLLGTDYADAGTTWEKYSDGHFFDAIPAQHWWAPDAGGCSHTSWNSSNHCPSGSPQYDCEPGLSQQRRACSAVANSATTAGSRGGASNAHGCR